MDVPGSPSRRTGSLCRFCSTCRTVGSLIPGSTLSVTHLKLVKSEKKKENHFLPCTSMSPKFDVSTDRWAQTDLEITQANEKIWAKHKEKLLKTPREQTHFKPSVPRPFFSFFPSFFLLFTCSQPYRSEIFWLSSHVLAPDREACD